MKYETYTRYDPARVALAESGFLTVWAGLGSWHDDLVLIGGLVPKYLCGDLTASRDLPRPVTLDTDLGIGLNASNGQYGSLHMDLQAQGFRLSTDDFGGPRFVKTVNDFDILVDFLAEGPPCHLGNRHRGRHPRQRAARREPCARHSPPGPGRWHRPFRCNATLHSQGL